MAQLEELDVVVLIEDFKGLKKNSVGTIIYLYGGKRHALIELQDNETEIIPLNKLELKK